MKKLFLIISVSILMIALGFGNSFALPAAKATAQFRRVTGITLTGEWVTVFKQWIKTPSAKDLFIDASFEAGLTTNTAVMSKQLVRAIAEAEAKVQVRVVLDENYDSPVEPGEITFASRKQTLVAEFAGLYDLWDSECVQITTDPTTGAVTSITFSDAPGCFDAEYLQLILSTMSANSFNFIAVDVPQGTHCIEVQVMLDYDLGDGIGIFDRPDLAEEVQSWSGAGSEAWVGKGSVTIESVRMIKDDGADDPPTIE